jgi:hypothetical protein
MAAQVGLPGWLAERLSFLPSSEKLTAIGDLKFAQRVEWMQQARLAPKVASTNKDMNDELNNLCLKLLCLLRDTNPRALFSANKTASANAGGGYVPLLTGDAVARFAKEIKRTTNFKEDGPENLAQQLFKMFELPFQPPEISDNPFYTFILGSGEQLPTNIPQLRQYIHRLGSKPTENDPVVERLKVFHLWDPHQRGEQAGAACNAVELLATWAKLEQAAHEALIEAGKMVPSEQDEGDKTDKELQEVFLSPPAHASPMPSVSLFPIMYRVSPSFLLAFALGPRSVPYFLSSGPLTWCRSAASCAS